MSGIWRPSSICAALLCAAMFAPTPGLAQYGATNGEWRSYGGDAGSTKYSPLDQIDASNFSDLNVAWRWQSADGSLDLETLREQIPELSIRGLQATPLMVSGVLYISTSLHQAAAVDAGTGATIWVHDPKAYLGGLPTHAYRSRGVAYWTDGEQARIFWGTSEGYLVGVDAYTGQPVRSFGDNGRVDLMADIPRAIRGAKDHRGRNLLGVGSPPIVSNDVIVTPTIITDYATRREAPPGWLKGVDARTGETALHKAVIQGYPQVVRYLAAADPSLKDNQGMLPIQHAAREGQSVIFQTLVEHGADYSVKDARGWNLLHLASFHGHVAIVKFLVVVLGENLHTNTPDGKKALQLTKSDACKAFMQDRMLGDLQEKVG